MYFVATGICSISNIGNQGGNFWALICHDTMLEA